MIVEWVLISVMYNSGAVNISMANQNNCVMAMNQIYNQYKGRTYCINTQTGQVIFPEE